MTGGYMPTGRPPIDPYAPIPAKETNGVTRAALAVAEGLTLECTDLRNAERLLEIYGSDLRYVGSWGKWLVWDGARWPLDEKGEVLEKAKATARLLAEEAEARITAANAQLEAIEKGWTTLASKEKRAKQGAMDREQTERLARLEAEVRSALALKAWAQQSQMDPRLHAMVDVAKSDPKVAIVHTMLDVDTMLLNVENGTIDLRTGELRPHRREDLMTKLAPVAYEPSAKRSRFELFMREISCGDIELVEFHKRFLGYCLTGETREHIFAFWYGTGGNGKSILANLLMHVMGDYAIKAMPDLVFRPDKSEKHETELCDLHGRRLVFCNETKQGRVLDDGRIKDLTGGDPIRARRMREDSWQWNPTHKLALFGQYKPTLRSVDGGMKRRTKLVPFAATFEGEKKDDRLQETLYAESSGVLAYFVEGCAAWNKLGLPAAKAIDLATANYFSEEDVIGQFFEAECVLHADAKVTRKELRERYVKWTEERGDERPLGSKAFTQATRDRGGRDCSIRCGDGRMRDGWRGVRLLLDGEKATKAEARADAVCPGEQTSMPSVQRGEPT